MCWCIRVERFNGFAKVRSGRRKDQWSGWHGGNYTEGLSCPSASRGKTVAPHAVMRVRLRATDDEWRVVDDDGQAWVTFAGSRARMFALHHVLQLTAQFG